MFAISNKNRRRKSPAFTTVNVKQEKRQDRQLPTGRLKVPGFSDYESVWWEAPEGSRNEGDNYAGVFRIGRDRKSGREIRYRTFPVGDGLFANILGSCELLGYFCDDPMYSDSDQKLFLNVSLDVQEALFKHLNPRIFDSAENNTGRSSSLADSVAFTAADQLRGSRR